MRAVRPGEHQAEKFVPAGVCGGAHGRESVFVQGLPGDVEATHRRGNAEATHRRGNAEAT